MLREENEMQSTKKKLSDKRREAMPSTVVHLRVPNAVHRKMIALALRDGKVTTEVYREMIAIGLRMSA